MPLSQVLFAASPSIDQLIRTFSFARFTTEFFCGPNFYRVSSCSPALWPWGSQALEVLASSPLLAVSQTRWLPFGKLMVPFFILCMLQDATGGTYFVGFLILCVAVGFCVSALADFFMLTKVFRWNPLKTCQL